MMPPSGGAQPVTGKIRYEAEITGHLPPFKWKVYRIGGPNPYGAGPATSRHAVANCEGEADTFQEARHEAGEAAWRAEYLRMHTTTKELVVVLEVDDVPIDREPDEDSDEEEDEILVAEKPDAA